MGKSPQSGSPRGTAAVRGTSTPPGAVADAAAGFDAGPGKVPPDRAKCHGPPKNPLTAPPRRASLGAQQPRRRGGGRVPAPPEAAFIVFGLGSQAVLAAFFAARRWRPRLANRYGWLAYAVAGLGLPLGLWFLAAGYSWRLYAGPLLLGCWAVFGSYLDLWRRVEWRSPPRPGCWSPTWPCTSGPRCSCGGRSGTCSAARGPHSSVLFAVNTALNLTGHFRRPESRRVSRRG